MSFELISSPEAEATLEHLRKKAQASGQKQKARGKQKSTKAIGLFKQVNKTLALLAGNPRHPGLHTHEYDSLTNPFDSHDKVWEAYVQNQTSGAYRIFWCYGPKQGQLYVIAITPHP